jgi:hypothetical protein
MKRIYINGENPKGVLRLVTDVFALKEPDVFGLTHFGFVRHHGENKVVGATSADAPVWVDCALGGKLIREILNEQKVMQLALW